MTELTVNYLKRWSKWIACALILAIITLAPTHPAAAQDGNLLVNPSFEYPYEPDLRGDGGGFIAHGWSAWWYNDSGDQYDAPEFKTANIEVDATRIRNGVAAQQYFKDWARHMAGVYQRVQVPANSTLRFTVYGQAWASFCEQKAKGIECDPTDSTKGGVNPMTMKVGIDPTGGTDPLSSSVVWSGARAVYDHYEQFAVEATASGEFVTVFVYSSPEWGTAVTNVYWDDASLTTSGGSSGSGSAPNNPPAGTGNTGNTGGVGSIPTQPAREDGSQWHVVQSGETLGGIAVAYGLETQTLRNLNSLTTDILFAGQELLIRPASEAPATAEPTQAQSAPPTAVPEAVAEIPEEAAGSQICLSLFNDANENGLQDAGEALLSGGTLSVSGLSTFSHVTDGLSEPHCFDGLTAGNYQASVEAPADHHLTGLASVPVTLSENGQVNLSFGAAQGAPVPEESENTSTTKVSAGMPPVAIMAMGGVGLLMVLSAIGAAALFLINRRKVS